MKKWKLMVFMIGIMVAEPITAQSKKLTITFYSAEKEGVILVAGYVVDSTFMILEKAVIKESVPFEEGSAVIDLLIPNGIVAISAFHDLDGDSELDKSIIGIPTEPYGFSNDARGIFGPPAYNECLINLEKTTQITIHLK